MSACYCEANEMSRGTIYLEANVDCFALFAMTADITF